MKTTINQLRNALDHDLGRAITLFRQNVKISSAYYNLILSQSGPYYNAERAFYEKNITQNDRDEVFKDILDTLVDILNKLTDKDLAEPSKDSELAKKWGLPHAPPNDLDFLLKDLKLKWDKIREIHLVNCNRKKEDDILWDKYRERCKQGQKFQFFFITACPTQKPEDFAERFIMDKRQSDKQIPERKKNLESVGSNNSETFLARLAGYRLVKEELPFDKGGIEDSKQSLVKYFEERFSFHDDGKSPEEFIQSCVQKNFEGKKYVTFIFTVKASEWNSILSEYLNWIMVTFTSIKDTNGLPEFLFFFAVHVLGLHDQAASGSLDTVIKELSKMNAAANPKDEFDKPLPTPSNVPFDMIMPLHPVSKRDAILWFSELGELNRAKVENLLMLTLQREDALTPLSRFLEENGSIDMEDVGYLQEKIYQYAMK